MLLIDWRQIFIYKFINFIDFNTLNEVKIKKFKFYNFHKKVLSKFNGESGFNNLI